MNMIPILKNARNKKIFLNHEFEELIKKIQRADSDLILDWDDGAGEEWARFSNQKNGIVCMINVRIGVAFVRKSYEFHNIEHIVNELEIVFVENYSADNWSIDLKELEQEVPELYWHTSEDAVCSNCFSLDDLYFATI